MSSVLVSPPCTLCRNQSCVHVWLLFRLCVSLCFCACQVSVLVYLWAECGLRLTHMSGLVCGSVCILSYLSVGMFGYVHLWSMCLCSVTLSLCLVCMSGSRCVVFLVLTVFWPMHVKCCFTSCQLDCFQPRSQGVSPLPCTLSESPFGLCCVVVILFSCMCNVQSAFF